MQLIDFIIGALAMNAMPHLVLGLWKGRMFSAYGFGNKQNIAYGFSCLALSVSLFVYRYGFEAILQNGLYAGALSILLIYFISGHFWYRLFNKAES